MQAPLHTTVSCLRSTPKLTVKLNNHRQTAEDSDYRLKVEYETKVHHKG